MADLQPSPFAESLSSKVSYHYPRCVLPSSVSSLTPHTTRSPPFPRHYVLFQSLRSASDMRNTITGVFPVLQRPPQPREAVVAWMRRSWKRASILRSRDYYENNVERNMWSVIEQCGSHREGRARGVPTIDGYRTLIVMGATVAERSAYSPPTKANLVQSPAGSRVGIVWDNAVGDLPFSPPLSFPHRSILTLINLIGSQDVNVKYHPNLFTYSHYDQFRKVNQACLLHGTPILVNDREIVSYKVMASDEHFKTNISLCEWSLLSAELQRILILEPNNVDSQIVTAELWLPFKSRVVEKLKSPLSELWGWLKVPLDRPLPSVAQSACFSTTSPAYLPPLRPQAYRKVIYIRRPHNQELRQVSTAPRTTPGIHSTANNDKCPQHRELSQTSTAP
ncbi:hypothetical protein PR048_005098 [Dryococelus australis]|uniref:Uncharacterized protein n=1 Tax=Dryococelus australis TaxID=614101 RepID=A0ABQ9I789_9NEOP|nr:hypothetical protein PR048_005098 [Dryococelus australis]